MWKVHRTQTLPSSKHVIFEKRTKRIELNLGGCGQTRFVNQGSQPQVSGLAGFRSDRNRIKVRVSRKCVSGKANSRQRQRERKIWKRKLCPNRNVRANEEVKGGEVKERKRPKSKIVFCWTSIEACNKPNRRRIHMLRFKNETRRRGRGRRRRRRRRIERTKQDRKWKFINFVMTKWNQRKRTKKVRVRREEHVCDWHDRHRSELWSKSWLEMFESLVCLFIFV